jgi:hypothetical protein
MPKKCLFGLRRSTRMKHFDEIKDANKHCQIFPTAAVNKTADPKFKC